MSASALLQVRNLRVSFRGVPVLHGLDFDVERGQVLGIVGESGAGKSMTMRGVLDAVPGGERTADIVQLDGIDLLHASAEAMRLTLNRRIGFVAQDARAVLNPYQRIGRSLHDVLCATRPMPRMQAREAMLDALRAVRLPDPSGVLRRYPHEISGGMAQRVLIAGALINRPDLIIADEATTGLDPSVEVDILDLLKSRIAAQGAGAILVTHEIGIVRHVCSHVLVMYAGRIVESGPVAAVTAHPAHPYSAMLLLAAGLQPMPEPAHAVLAGPDRSAGCAYAGHCPHTAPVCHDGPIPRQRDGARSSLCRLPIGTLDRIAAPSRPTVRTPGAGGNAGATTPRPILIVEGLRKSFFPRAAGPPIRALNGVDLHVAPGETLALTGESGAGKSTLGRCVVRLIDVDEGRITIDGHEVADEPRSVFRARRRLIQTVFQDPSASIDPRFEALDVLLEPLRVFQPMLDDRKRRSVAVGLMEAVGLGPHLARRRASALSGGQKQRLAIARALAPDPLILVLDEPTASLDMSIRGQVLALLDDLQAKKGLAYLLITHDMASVARLAHRAAVMYLGEIVEEAPAEAILYRPRHPYSRALAAAVLSGTASPEAERLRGDSPRPTDLPAACFFASRCPYRRPVCDAGHPALISVEPGWRVRCRRVGEI